MGERHAPCGTPLRVNSGPVRWDMRMEAVLSCMKFERMRLNEGCKLRRNILCLNHSCQTLSKTLETLRRLSYWMCVLLGVGYGFMEDGEGGVRPSTSPESMLVVVVKIVSVRC